VSGGSVTGNNKVWRQLTFTPVTTAKIRVLTNASPDGYSRLTEVEAWGTAAGGGSGSTPAEINWLVTDQLGTPRMVFDKSGSLASMKRHDYLPFGEELFANVGARTQTQGYSLSDGIRQQFTLKERDIETGLDYFLARYYSYTQGRFTSPDEFNGGSREVFILGTGDQEKQALPYAEITNPQSLNKYTYVYNNPLRFIDPDGHQGQEGWLTRLLRWWSRQADPEQEAEQPRRGPLSMDADKVSAQFTKEVVSQTLDVAETLHTYGADFNMLEMAKAMDRKDAVGTSVAAIFMAIDGNGPRTDPFDSNDEFGSRCLDFVWGLSRSR
jgi:RHS repeat-associated protein